VRTCVGCRSRRYTARLVRVAIGDEGKLVISRLSPGRGAWLCMDVHSLGPEPSCFAAAIARNGLARALRASLPPGAVAGLRARLEERAIMDQRQPPNGHQSQIQKGHPQQLA